MMHTVYLHSMCRVRDDWSFDDDMHDKQGCEVHSFDPRYL
jgi:hypothetical protein